MRVAKDAEVWLFAIQKGSSILRELPAFIQNVTGGNAAACQFDHGLYQDAEKVPQPENAER